MSKELPPVGYGQPVDVGGASTFSDPITPPTEGDQTPTTFPPKMDIRTGLSKTPPPGPEHPPPPVLDAPAKPPSTDLSSHTQRPLTEQVANNLRRTVQTLGQLMKEGNLNYDTYFETIIQTIHSGALAQTVELLLDANATQSRWVQEAIARVEQTLGPSHAALLVDPGIAYRLDAFINFANQYLEQHGPTKPLALRRAFIDDRELFPVKYFYRGLVVDEPDQIAAPGSSTRVRLCCGASEQFVASQQEKIDRGVRLYRDRPQYLSLMGLLPLFSTDGLRADAYYHLHNASSRGSFISVSEHPQICWFAACDNGEAGWKEWPPNKQLAMFRFQISSYYALPRGLLSDAWRHSKAVYHIRDAEGELKLACSDNSVEQLIPIGVRPECVEPPRFYQPEHHAARPRRFGRKKDTLSFRVPKPEDWS